VACWSGTLAHFLRKHAAANDYGVSNRLAGALRRGSKPAAISYLGITRGNQRCVIIFHTAAPCVKVFEQEMVRIRRLLFFPKRFAKSWKPFPTRQSKSPNINEISRL
jgi:hypothetical protein